MSKISNFGLNRLRSLWMAIFCFALLASPSFAQTGSDDPSRWSGQNWQTDFSQSTIAYSEVVDVIQRDQIPSIDQPKFAPAAEESRIPGNEPVVAFSLDGTARAYPIRYLMWHEIVNDQIGDTPIAVTYCPLCNTSVVFERVLDGEVTTFGTTGKLRHSDLIMYDRSEQNWWQQFNGEAIAGTRAGQRLRIFPSSLISFDQFLQRFPNGEVLLPDERRAQMAGRNPYVNYDSNPLPFLFNGALPQDIEAMERVALVQGDEPLAVTVSFLNEHAPYELGGYEFTWQAGQASALDASRISNGRDVGSIEVFRLEDETRIPVPYVVTFAFSARAFWPDLEIIQLAE